MFSPCIVSSVGAAGSDELRCVKNIHLDSPGRVLLRPRAGEGEGCIGLVLVAVSLLLGLKRYYNNIIGKLDCYHSKGKSTAQVSLVENI